MKDQLIRQNDRHAAGLAPYDETPEQAAHTGKLRNDPDYLERWADHELRHRRIGYEQYLVIIGECPEVVPVMTEDGPTTGRCLQPITDTEVCACEGHAQEIRGWHAMNEFEKLEWERRQDDIF